MGKGGRMIFLMKNYNNMKPNYTQIKKDLAKKYTTVPLRKKKPRTVAEMEQIIERMQIMEKVVDKRIRKLERENQILETTLNYCVLPFSNPTPKQTLWSQIKKAIRSLLV